MKILNYLISTIYFQTLIICSKMPVDPSEVVITVQKKFLPDNTSAVAHLYEMCMAELWITEYSGFMKDFVSFTMKNIHPFYVFYTNL